MSVARLLRQPQIAGIRRVNEQKRMKLWGIPALQGSGGLAKIPASQTMIRPYTERIISLANPEMDMPRKLVSEAR